jgi:NtrC-family two-component system response regulator AlgB
MPDVRKPRLKLRVLILDDELEIRRTLTTCLELGGHQVMSCANPRDALNELSRSAFDLVFLDLRLGLDDGMKYLPNILTLGNGAQVVVITAYASVATAVEAMKAGATDYLSKPFTPAQVNLLTKKIAEQRAMERKLLAAQEALGNAAPEADLTTTSARMQELLNEARAAAGTDSSVLLCGEAGIGKSVLARLIHEWSDRADGRLVTVAGETDSDAKIEHQLFGRDNSGGLLRQNHGGTVVIEEVTELGPSLQAKLLQFLKEGQADVRVIATTRLDPEFSVSSGKLSRELFYALAVFKLMIPPLRSRQDDILLLAERYRIFFTKQYRKPVVGFAPEAAEALRKYEWPGNIRELRNMVERAAIVTGSDRIGVVDLPAEQLEKKNRLAIGDAAPLEAVEQLHIRRVLESAESFDHAAQILQIDPATLWRKRKKYGF